LAPTRSAGADQPPRAAAAFTGCRAGRGVGVARAAGRRVVVGRGDALARAVACGVALDAVRVDSDGSGVEDSAAGAVAVGLGAGTAAGDDGDVEADVKAEGVGVVVGGVVLTVGYVAPWSPSSASDQDGDPVGVGIGSATVGAGASVVIRPKAAPPTSIAVAAITRPRGVSCTTGPPDGRGPPTGSRPRRSSR
jgi:hypothetical protein